MRTAPARRRTVGLLAAALLGCLLAPAPARAHRLDATITHPLDRPGRMKVEANYGDGEPAADAVCSVVDGRDEEIARDRTDAEGVCYFIRPPVGRYTLIVDDGAGHRARLAFEISEELAADRDATTRRDRWLAVVGGLLLISVMPFVLRRVRRLPPAAPPMPGT